MVRPNQSALGRSTTISVGGQNFNIDQQGGSVCTFVVTPTYVTLGSGGGSARVVVNEPAACAWNAISNTSWVHVTAGADSFGNAAVALGIDANSGAARSGTLTIAGQTVSVSQGASTSQGGTCGSAVDVTARVNVYRSGFTPIDLLGYLESQTVTVTNITRLPIPGPLFLVFEGLPTSQVIVENAPPIGQLSSLTTCFSPQGDVIVALTGFALASGSLPPGQTAGYLPLFAKQDWWDFINYVPRILSGFPPIK